MADTGIAIQPSAPATPPPAPVIVKTFQQADELGNIVQIQAVMLVDEFGRYQQLMTEKTGRQLVMAIRDLHQAYIGNDGGMFPAVNETLTEE